MTTLFTLGFEPHGNGGCCLAGFDNLHAGPYGCAERATVFTRREEGILHQIREAGKKAQEIKARLRNVKLGDAADSREEKAAVEELARLRDMRKALELERLAAAEERMRLLGHA